MFHVEHSVMTVLYRHLRAIIYLTNQSDFLLW